MGAARIGVLTGGGDVPGLNPCIKAIVERASEAGMEVVGIRRGWAGLLDFDLEAADGQGRWIEPLTPASVRAIDRFGGTHLHTSRTNPGKVRPDAVPGFLEGRFSADGDGGTIDCTPHVLSVLDHLGIEALVPIGGDDTLSYGARLDREGVRVIAVPKTMDNDVYGTDYCIGFSTAVTRSVELINALRTPTGSHERVAVVELFGRNSGETALVSAFLADADRTLISEVPFDPEHLSELVAADRAANPSNYAIVVVSEGASMTGGTVVESGPEDAYGHRKLGGIGATIAAEIKARTGVDTLHQELAYLMRAGPPDSLDRMVAISYGRLAVEELKRGSSGRMVVVSEGRYTTVPADTPVKGVKRVDVEAFYDARDYRPSVAHTLGTPMFLY